MSLRYLNLVPLLLLFASLAAPAFGGIPDPEHCTVPPCLVVCPAGDDTFIVVVRDVANNPAPLGCWVTLRFDGCSGFHVCPDCCPNVAIDWQNHRATAYTDSNGAARFPLKMGGVCTGATVWVLACNVSLAHVQMASPDQDGDLDVDASDAAHVNSLIGSHDPGADFDCDGTVTQADLDWLANGHGGHSCAGIVPVPPSSWGSVKLHYR